MRWGFLIRAICLVLGLCAAPAGAQTPLRYYLAEGATGPQFTFDLDLFNPNAESAPTRIRFMRALGPPIYRDVVLAPWGRLTLRVNDVEGLSHDYDIATTVESLAGLPLAIERTMAWGEGRYGAHSSRAAVAPSTTWYFAEGAQGLFDTYLLLANPGDAEVAVTVRFLREGTDPVETVVVMPGMSRRTLFAGAFAELIGESFGVEVRASGPVVAERAMYFSGRRFWEDGHASLGIASPAETWAFAEGVTGPLFDSFILLANPGPAAASVSIRAMREDGVEVVHELTLGPSRRQTVWLDTLDPRLADTVMSVIVESTAPIIAERSSYWGHNGSWVGGQSSPGAPRSSPSWAMSAVRLGGPERAETFLLALNRSASPAQLRVRVFDESGLLVDAPYVVGPRRRFTLPLSTILPFHYGSVSVLVDSVDGAPFVVDRATYWDADGIWWAAGVASEATPLSAGDSSVRVNEAVRRLEERWLAVDVADPPVAPPGFVFLHGPDLLRQDIEAPPYPGTAAYALTIPLLKIGSGAATAGQWLEVTLNGVEVGRVAVSDLRTDQWTTFRAVVAISSLQPASNSIMVRPAGLSWDVGVAVYASSPGPDGYNSCASTDGGATWDCVDPAPGDWQSLPGFRLHIELVPLPDVANVEPRYRYLLDGDRFAFASLLSTYAPHRLGPYFIDPLDPSELDDLVPVVEALRGLNDFDTARNIMRFLNTVLTPARVANDSQDTWRILMRDRGAWCSGNAFAFVGLAALAGIDARAVQARQVLSDGSEAGHVFAEAWIDGGWVVFDPFSGLVLQVLDDDGRWKRYSALQIASDRDELRLAPIEVFDDLRFTEGMARGAQLGDVTFTGDDAPAVQTLIDFFNEDLLVVRGAGLLPYYPGRTPTQ